MKKIIIACIAVVAAIAAFLAIDWYRVHRTPNFTGKADLYVLPGSTLDEIMKQIPDSIVKHPALLEKTMRKELQDGQVKPGHYVIEKAKPSIYVTRMLANGWETPVSLVLSGSMRLKGQIARKISRQMMVDSATVANALEDKELLAQYGFTPQDVFSLIIPDSYEMYWTASMKDILDKQKEAYDAFWTPENLQKAKDQGLTQKEVSIVASIVKGESNHEPEYPSIAGVYLNRYHIGMLLQADPTIAYCYDYTLNRILLRHLEVDSPYNTYKYPGLPPGPICVPDKAALNAVLNPDRHGYLFFCASAAFDGTHKFATTLSEHNRNAQEFQRALNARQAAQRAAQN